LATFTHSSQTRSLSRRWRFHTVDDPGSLGTILFDIDDAGPVGDYSDAWL
jgi:hypothetical protein